MSDTPEHFKNGPDNFESVAEKVINDLFGREADEGLVSVVLSRNDVESMKRNTIKIPVSDARATALDKLLYGVSAGAFTYKVMSCYQDLALVHFFGTGLLMDLSAHPNCVENVETV